MQQGSLGGTTPDTTFQIVCDGSNNTPSTTAAGIVNVSVAVALTSPAEFIMINISQYQNTGVTTVSTGV
jgi:phage tail sheath protein FI